MPELSPVTEKFILHWGEMGARWGINRTVAQIHALLYISPKPLNAEEITKALSVARSNVSTSLRELVGWGVVKVIHVMGDRRDHYETLKDVWEMFHIICDERKRREIDPTLEVLRACVSESKGGSAADERAGAAIGEMLEFFESMDKWYNRLSGMPLDKIKRFVKMSARIRKALGLVS